MKRMFKNNNFVIFSFLLIIGMTAFGSTTLINISQVNGLQTALNGKSATTGDANIATVGTVTTGTWNATAITVPYGGSGLTSLTPYALLAGGTTSTGNLQQISGLGTSGQVLTSNGAGQLPTWQTVSGSGTVTNFSAGDLIGFFTSSVATSTSTPALTFNLTNAAAHKFWGNNTGSTGVPSYVSIAEGDVTNLTTDLGNKLTIAKYIARETPSGLVNGSNTAFTLSNSPVAGTEMVVLNGLLQDVGAGNDYTISGSTITFATAPISGDKIRVTYISQ